MVLLTDEDVEDALEDREQEEDFSEENLPALVSSPPALIDITPEASLKDVIREDTKQINYTLSCLHRAWSRVSTIDEVCKLALTTTKVLKDRRELMNLQLGSKKDSLSFGHGYASPYGDN